MVNMPNLIFDPPIGGSVRPLIGDFRYEVWRQNDQMGCSLQTDGYYEEQCYRTNNMIESYMIESWRFPVGRLDIDERNRMIVEDYLTGQYTQEKLGKKYGLSQSMISKILRSMLN